jgi:hypothetical protein
MPLLPYVISRYAPLLPLYFLWLLGIILALIRWRRHPTVSLVAALACVILILNTMSSTVVYAWLPGYLFQGGDLTPQQGANIMMVVEVFFNLVSAVAWALILVAIFAERNRREKVTDMQGPREAQD